MDKATYYKYRSMVEANPHELLLMLPELQANTKDHISQGFFFLLKAMSLTQMQQFTEAESVAQELLSLATELENSHLLCRVHIVLSKCVKLGAMWPKHYLHLALHIAQNSQELELIAEVQCHLATYWAKEGDLKKAQKLFGMAEDLAIRAQDPWTLENIYLDAATANYQVKQLDKAIKFMTLALEQSQLTGNLDRQLLCMCNLATLYMELTRYQDAEQLLIKALGISNSTHTQNRRLMILVSLGAVMLHQDRYQESIHYYRQCEILAQELDFPYNSFLLNLYSNLAGALRYSGAYDEALMYLDHADKCAIAMQDEAERLSVSMNRANLYSAIGKETEALKMLSSIIKSCKKSKKYDLWIVAQNNLADIYRKKKQYLKAISTLRELNSIFKDYLSTVVSEQTMFYDRKIEEISLKLETQQSKGSPESYSTETFIGISPAARRVLEQAKLAARFDKSNIVIQGESGTGKEIIANLIHYGSSRKDYPIVAVNAAAITASLVESELFGHVKGAFTGAYNNSKGIFERAQHGSVFLDEIADMPFELQAKLLRALETRKLTPVGGKEEIPFDCRIICSTNKDLDQMVQQEKFRLDLLHRLNTIMIYIPPLRERREDIVPLIDYYVWLYSTERSISPPEIDKEFYVGLSQYPFPGNVRELKNIIERLFIMHHETKWGIKQLEQLNLFNPPEKPILQNVKEKLLAEERDQIIEALQKCNGKQKTAAKLLGISESTLTRRIEKYNLARYTMRGQ